MVPDYVSTTGDFGNDVRSLADVTADEKERGMNVMAGENIEQMESVRIVGSIVEGQGNLLRAARAAAKSASKPLAGGGHGLVSSGGCCDYGRSGDSRVQARLDCKCLNDPIPQRFNRC